MKARILKRHAYTVLSPGSKEGAHEAKTVASIDAKTLFDSWNERRKVKRLFRRLIRSLGRRQSPSKQ